jgi:hypothetical protein
MFGHPVVHTVGTCDKRYYYFNQFIYDKCYNFTLYRWNGYNVDEHKKIAKEYEKIELVSEK